MLALFQFLALLTKNDDFWYEKSIWCVEKFNEGDYLAPAYQRFIVPEWLRVDL